MFNLVTLDDIILVHQIETFDQAFRRQSLKLQARLDKPNTIIVPSGIR